MFTQVDFEATAGKTVRAVVRTDDDEVIVSFTDGTFSSLRSFRVFNSVELDTDAPFSMLDYKIDLVTKPLFGESAEPMYKRDLDERNKRKERLELELAAKRRAEYEAMKLEFGE